MSAKSTRDDWSLPELIAMGDAEREGGASR
jgi:hypothetical protein